MVERQVLQPAGMASTTFEVPRDAARGHVDGVPVPPWRQPRARRPTAGLWSTVDDLLGFGEFLLADAELLATVRTPRTPASSETQYGLGWCVEGNAIVHWGSAVGFGFRSVLRVAPDERAVSVVLVDDERGGAAIDVLMDSRGPW